jgi:hypothetical protein
MPAPTLEARLAAALIRIEDLQADLAMKEATIRDQTREIWRLEILLGPARHHQAMTFSHPEDPERRCHVYGPVDSIQALNGLLHREVPTC